MLTPKNLQLIMNELVNLISLFQKASKKRGVCSICFATRQIQQKNGTLHLHGPRHQPCPGSNLPPIGNAPSSQASQNQVNTQLSSADGHSSVQQNADILSTSGAAPPFASVST